MALSQDIVADQSAQNVPNELDIYASEFAKLVSSHSPSRRSTPAEWLRRLPNEVFYYYEQGISTFESNADSPAERRGRLYLIHTGLLFMWMRWGKKKAREQFQSQAARSTRRAATLTTLEHYRRGGVLAHYDCGDWFFDPVSDWTVKLISEAVAAEHLSDDALKETVHTETTTLCSIETFSSLRKEGAIPATSSLSLN